MAPATCRRSFSRCTSFILRRPANRRLQIGLQALPARRPLSLYLIYRHAVSRIFLQKQTKETKTGRALASAAGTVLASRPSSATAAPAGSARPLIPPFSPIGGEGATTKAAPASFSWLPSVRFSALSQIETGDCDFMVGRDGEVSRYQISPLVVREYQLERGSLTNPVIALEAARVIMADRQRHFAARYGRAPTPFEFYILWNHPRALFHLPPAISAAVVDRAQRFTNLLGNQEARSSPAFMGSLSKIGGHP